MFIYSTLLVVPLEQLELVVEERDRYLSCLDFHHDLRK